MTYGLLLCVLILVFPGGGVSARNWKAGHTLIRVTDPADGQRKIAVEVWYPAEKEGKGESPAGEGKPLPVIVFGHGYLLSPASYRHIVDLVVPEGYVVVFPLTERGMFPSHRRLAEDLAVVAGQVAVWNGEHGSLFYGRLSETVCLMGHSMGGGAAVLAAAMEPRIRALALLAPFDTRPSAIAAACGVSCPALIIAGSSDCVTPPPKHQIPLYEALASGDKIYLSLTGGTHCGMTSSPLLCQAAECTCFPKKTISREEQHALIGHYLLPWLHARLGGLREEAVRLEVTLPADPRVTWRSSTF